MNEKINHPDLSALLAKEANISVTKAENFTKALFDIIIEGLEQDNVVKINGLGTFKVTEVANRYSVNVNTGEKIEIKGHKKLSFIAAESLKESVNRPFAMFEPVEIDDSYQEEADSADEISAPSETETAECPTSDNVPQPLDIAEIEEEMPCEQSSEAPVAPNAQISIEEELSREECDEAATTFTTPVQQTVEEITAEECSEPENTPQPHVDEEQTIVNAQQTTQENIEPEKEISAKAPAEKAQPAEEQQKTIPSTPDKNNSAAVATKKRNSSPLLIIIASIIIVAGIFSYLLLEKKNTATKKEQPTFVADNAPSIPAVNNQKANISPKTNLPQQTIEDKEPFQQPLPVAVEPEIKQENSATEYNFVLVDELAAKSDKNITDADTTIYLSTGIITTHIVVEDERLAKIAFNYYGSRKLWPYIAKYNNLKKPYGIVVGMKLKIPKLQPK